MKALRVLLFAAIITGQGLIVQRIVQSAGCVNAYLVTAIWWGILGTIDGVLLRIAGIFKFLFEEDRG